MNQALETTLIDTDQLRAFFKYQRPADLERCLAKNGVKFLQGKDGPVTTKEALHLALGITEKSEHDFEPMVLKR